MRGSKAKLIRRALGIKKPAQLYVGLAKDGRGVPCLRLVNPVLNRYRRAKRGLPPRTEEPYLLE